MGKKKNKTKSTGSLLNDNRILFAALGGVAAGISLAGIFGADKAKKIVDTVGNAVNTFSSKLKDQLKNESFVPEPETKSWKVPKPEKELA